MDIIPTDLTRYAFLHDMNYSGYVSVCGRYNVLPLSLEDWTTDRARRIALDNATIQSKHHGS